MPLPLWTAVLTDLSGAALGEFAGKAFERKLRHAFNARLKTFSTRIRIDHPLVANVMTGATLLKVYEGTTLRFVGVQTSGEEVAEGTGASITASWADPFVRLQNRLLGKTVNGAVLGYTDGTPLAPKDKSVLVQNMLAAANASGYTGIELGTVTNVGVTSFVEYAPYKPAAEAIAEIVNNLDGPDIEIVPSEPTVIGAGLKLATMNIVPVIGTSRPDAVFEYGDGRRNAASYRRALDLSLMLNRAYVLPPSSDPTGAVLSASDATSQSTYGVFEGVVPTELSVADLRQKTVNEHVRVRKVPRQQITFSPTRDDPAYPGRVPKYGTDFFLGDVIPFRAIDPVSKIVRVNGSLRVYAVDWDIDDNGTGIPSFTLTAD